MSVSIHAKRRVFFGALVLLVVWPLVHYVLSRRYHFNHWRFAGFAMYARPSYRPYLQFAGDLNGRPLAPEDLQAALGADRKRVDEFLLARKLWGDLERPDAIGALILSRIPDLRVLKVVVIRVGLEPGDDYLSYAAFPYLCSRPAVPGGRVCTPAP